MGRRQYQFFSLAFPFVRIRSSIPNIRTTALVGDPACAAGVGANLANGWKVDSQQQPEIATIEVLRLGFANTAKRRSESHLKRSERWLTAAASYRSASMHSSSTAREGRVTLSGKVASGSSVMLSMSRK